MLLKMPQKLLKTAHYIELGSYQHWPVLIPQRIRLYTYEQIPLFLKENPYITDGYRAHLPSKLCLRSIFILSNETVNIWSHLLGFLLFFSLGVNDLSTVLPASGANREDYVIYAIGLFCFQVKVTAAHLMLSWFAHISVNQRLVDAAWQKLGFKPGEVYKSRPSWLDRKLNAKMFY